MKVCHGWQENVQVAENKDKNKVDGNKLPSERMNGSDAKLNC